MSKIYSEIRQGEPFEHVEEEAFVTLLRTSDVLRSALEAIFRRWGISLEQYDVLRILRRAPKGALPCLEIGSRILSRAPNITRLIDKLEQKRLVTRERQSDDRRVILVRITPEGQKVVGEATRPARAVILDAFGALGARQARQLVGFLDLVRDRARS